MKKKIEILQLNLRSNKARYKSFENMQQSPNTNQHCFCLEPLIFINTFWQQIFTGSQGLRK